MSHHNPIISDNPYLKFLSHILENGEDTTDRTGVGTRRVFGYDMRFDLSHDSFPLLTTKKCHFKSIVIELIWFLKGETNIHFLKENGVSIWDLWANEEGDLGPVYGHQWRYWRKSDGTCVDQIQNLIDGIKNNPFSRRHIVSAWNVGELDKMALPPCHAFFQFFVSQNGTLSCKLTQRSADAFLGVPFNIASYSLLTRLIALECGLKAGEFIWSGGDCHIYSNHFDVVYTQLSREPRPSPTLKILEKKPLDEYAYSDFLLENYDPHPTLRAKIAK